MKRILKTILIIILSVIVTYLFLHKTRQYSELYTIGNDVVSSVYKITDLKVNPKTDILENGTVKILTFNKVNDMLYNSVKYANYLWKNEGYYITSNYNFGKSEDGKIELAKTSSESGKIIKINVNCYTNNSFNVVLSLVNGDLMIRNSNSNK